MKSDKQKKLELGSFYTNDEISEYISQKVWGLVNNKNTSIIDPAMGNGNLLFAFTNLISKGKEKQVLLSGHDIDSEAIDEAKLRFSDTVFTTNFKIKDSIPLLAEKFNDKYDILVSNPPWGAKIGFSKEKLQSFGYETASNQFDSYDLFIELSLKMVKSEGIIAFILPDSIFLEQHKPIRKKILEETTLLTIYKLGEGFFEGVHRSTVLFIMKNEKSKPNHKIEIVILRKIKRKRVLLNELKLIDYEEDNKELIFQNQFFKNDYTINIELSNERDSEIIKKIEGKSKLRDFFSIGRGIEISKNGVFWKCNNCHYFEKKGKKEIEYCPECNGKIRKENVIIKKDSPGYIPIVVGEDFSRYSKPKPRYILDSIKGVNYKSNNLTDVPEKVLVRKTGLGITATLDTDRLHTNQVVYHIKSKSSNEFITVRSLLGILNSRTILFSHLKQSGETEWKSHPYLTQSILNNLSLPDIKGKDRQMDKLDELVSVLLTKGYTKELDLKIEKQVLLLYGLNIADLKYMNSYIAGIDQLKVISKMVISDHDIEEMDKV